MEAIKVYYYRYTIGTSQTSVMVGKTVDIGKVPPQLIVIEPVADDKNWLDFDSNIIELDCSFVYGRLRKERCDCQ